MHFTLTNPHTEASISYQMNLGEFRGKFSSLISTELAMGFIVLKRDLPLSMKPLKMIYFVNGYNKCTLLGFSSQKNTKCITKCKRHLTLS